jgi:hypothetical protein
MSCDLISARDACVRSCPIAKDRRCRCPWSMPTAGSYLRRRAPASSGSRGFLPRIRCWRRGQRRWSLRELWDCVGDFKPRRFVVGEYMPLRPHWRVRVETSRWDHRHTAFQCHLRHGAPALAAKRRGVKPCLGQLVFGDQVFATGPAELSRLEEDVGPVSRTPCTPAPHAMTTLHEHRLACCFVSDCSAEATTGGNAGLWLDLRSFQSHRTESGWVFFVSRQVVRDRVPRSLRAHEDMCLGFDTEIALEGAGWQECQRVGRHHHRHGGPADAATVARSLFRGFVLENCVLALDPVEMIHGCRDVGGKCRAVVLAAHRAMTTHHGVERSTDFVAHRSTEAGSIHHGRSPQGGRRERRSGGHEIQ